MLCDRRIKDILATRTVELGERLTWQVALTDRQRGLTFAENSRTATKIKRVVFLEHLIEAPVQ